MFVSTTLRRRHANIHETYRFIILEHQVLIWCILFLDKSNLKDNSTTTFSTLPTVKIGEHSPISRLWTMSDRGHQLQHIHAFYNQFKIFYFNIQCLPTLSFYDIKDAAVICVTLTDGLTSWDALMILWNTCVWVGWCWVRKNSGALVHLHHVSMTCSDAILCYFCIFLQTFTPTLQFWQKI